MRNLFLITVISVFLAARALTAQPLPAPLAQAEPEFKLLGQGDAGHQLVVENFGAGLPGLAGRERAAGFRGDVRGTEISGELQGPFCVLAADRSVVRVGLDPTWVPVRLPRVGHGVHHEGVDVGDREVVLRQRIADRLLLRFQ